MHKDCELPLPSNLGDEGKAHGGTSMGGRLALSCVKSHGGWTVEGVVMLRSLWQGFLCLTEAGWITRRLLHWAKFPNPLVSCKQGNWDSSGTAADTDGHRFRIMSEHAWTH